MMNTSQISLHTVTSKYSRMALKFIAKYPGHTIHEIDYLINNRQEGCRFVGRQLFDLVNDNLIRPVGFRTCSRSGNRSTTWKLNERKLGVKRKKKRQYNKKPNKKSR